MASSPAKATRKKVLLMGGSGSGKTSMRSVIFNQQNASDTSRLGATVNMESSSFRFLNNLALNIWDCGGQQNYMDGYLVTQRQHIFSDVAILIYVFDGSRPAAELQNNKEYFELCLEALGELSGTVDSSNPTSPTPASSSATGGPKSPLQAAHVYILVNKMDLVDNKELVKERCLELENFAKETLKPYPGIGHIKALGTSIWEDTLYRAWAQIIRTLIPNADILSQHLTKLRTLSESVEVVLFEKQTFLIIAKSGSSPEAGPDLIGSSAINSKSSGDAGDISRDLVLGEDGLDNVERDAGIGRILKMRFNGMIEPDDNGKVKGTERWEVMSRLFKEWRAELLSRIGENFQNWEMTFPNCTISLDGLTASTYCMIVTAESETSAQDLTEYIHFARKHFTEIEEGLVTTPCSICEHFASSTGLIKYQPVEAEESDEDDEDDDEGEGSQESEEDD